MCGERSARGGRKVEGAGSSPRVRGTDAVPATGATARRFIPACAGNGMSAKGLFCSCSVHPRVCGERPRQVRDRAPMAGSSPRVRGTEVIEELGSFDERFIPACAGNGGSVCV